MSFPTQTQPVLQSPVKYLRLRQIARRYPISYDSVRRMFMSLPGVIKITKPNPQRRSYTIWLVPESLVLQVFAAFTNGGRR
jgi:hypothetical protein